MDRFHSDGRSGSHSGRRRGLQISVTGIGLVFAAAVSALLFGSVEYWSAALAGALVIFLFTARVFTARKQIDAPRGVVYSMTALAVYPLFQMLPLPVSMLASLQPHLAGLIEIKPGSIPAFHSITLYIFPTEIAWARLVVYLMIFFTAAFLPGKGGAIYGILKALSAFGFVLALFGIIQHVTWNGKLYWMRPVDGRINPFGPFVDRDHFAGYINMLIPLSLALSLASRRIEKKVLYAFFSLVMTLSVFLTLSRGGVISFICGLAVFSAILLVRRSKSKSLKWQFAILAIFSVSLVSFILYAGISPLIARFSAGGISEDQRLLAWKSSLSVLKNFPVFGTGLGTFRNVFTGYQPVGLHKFWDHAHNDYIELLIETGFAGILTGAFFIFNVLRQAFRRRWQGKEVYLQAGFISSLVTISVHSLVDFNLHIPSNAILFFMILGLSFAAGTGQKNYAAK